MNIWKFGDDVNTDLITPGRFNLSTEPSYLAKYCFCEVRPDFVHAKKGDVVVAGRNFGCGSSRETAPVALLGCGVAVIAKSYARIFYRNAINIGLKIIVCKNTDRIDETDIIEIGDSFILNKTKNEKYVTDKLPDFVNGIIESGGIINYIKSGKFE